MMARRRARAVQWAARTRRRHRTAGAAVRAAAPFLPAGAPPRRPVFILGAPRSGTTMLFQLLDRSRSLASLSYGSQFLWELYRPRAIAPGRSHAAGPQDIAPHEPEAIAWLVRTIAGDMPYLDKFPRMILRAEYLAALFPDARFVHLVRDGRATTSSLMTGWRTAGKFGHGTRLPVRLEIAGYEGDVWRFLLPPGWEEYATGHTLAEVCAFQWSGANLAALEARDRLGADRFVEVRYEDLVADPVGVTGTLLGALGLAGDPDVLEHAAALSDRVTHTAVTPPRPDKWREENGAAVEGVLHRLEPVMRRLGYAM